MSPALILTLAAFWQARARAARLRSGAALQDWQSGRLRKFLAQQAPKAAAFSQFSSRSLTDFPEMDKAALMDRFEAYNIEGIAAAPAWRAYETTGRIGRYSVGASTGTSGNRGLYLVSDPERYLWLGTLLAKALPDVLSVRHRVAVMLPRSSRLYDAANESGRLALKFFDLSYGLERQFSAVSAFRPSVLVAPPHALIALARADLPLRPRLVFSGAEVLDQSDRAEIEARFSVAVREIYMATEGLLGVACSHGTLHLCEDCVAFEWENAAGLCAPLITDFTRRSQIMVRYRMNDLLRLSETPCPCGSPLQAVSEIVGRRDDAFVFPGVTVTPDIVRNAVVSADHRIADFRVIQKPDGTILLTLAPDLAPALPGARRALEAMLARLGVAAKVQTATAKLNPPTGGKLRRVVREQVTAA